MPRKDSILKLRITDDLKRDLEQIASERGETISVIVRQALRDYLTSLRSQNAEALGASPAADPSERVKYDASPSPVALVAEPGVPFHSGDAPSASPGEPSRQAGG